MWVLAAIIAIIIILYASSYHIIKLIPRRATT